MSEQPIGHEPIVLEHTDQKRSFNDTPLRKFFDACLRFEASDLHMRAGQVPRLRVRGTLRSLDVEPISAEDFEKAIELALSPAQWQMYAERGSIDIGYDLKEGCRFRVNVFRTRGRSGIAARRVTGQILDFQGLHLPESLGEVAQASQGLILLAGITGSGKSTTIASMLQHINERQPVHILTIEDPIEYLFQDAKATVNQREVGIDVPDFPTGLKALVREDPDIVFIGEMRDKTTFEAALQAAETGHLVFGTIHASSASQAFGRIYDLFPAEERDGIRNLLAYQMRAFVFQKLLPTICDDPPRVPAVEVLLQSPSTRRYIIEGREHALDEVIKGAREAGMQSFTDSLVDLVEKELIHPKTAEQFAISPEEVKMRLRGINTT